MLTDGCGRRVDYLRLSVTDRCDLRCSYCMPTGFKDYEEPAHWLSFDQIERLLSVFARLGMRRIRLTGGEPLLRNNLTELARRLAALPGVEDLSLSTNGTQLAKYASRLKAAGVTRLNVSLDSLDRRRVRAITKRDVLPQVLDGLEAARAAGFSLIKVNMVALAGTTDADIENMVAYCMERGFVLRLIETMPVGATGRDAGYLDLRPVRERLRARFGLVDGVVPGGGPARYLVAPDGGFQIGFITPISQHFCATCNRVRLSVDGRMFLCLGQDNAVDFRRLLLDGGDDAAIERALLDGLRAKPARHEFNQQPDRIVRFMSMTGG
ncbi:MAG: GTP 3',8-cyclase MoaA [Hydrogenophilales bacterium CG_4_10_14_3_um_filter_63_21]|nr:MAG: GTP 3',8-cyclase MoaA [Hydrogenophilales bacterium CG_4_10_14_3_um_filter_63_21]